MSGGLEVLSMKEDDMSKLLQASTHLGSNNVDYQMISYVFKRRSDGIHIIHLRKTWEKLLLAARAIAAIENPADVCVISSRPQGQRAVLKFASATGASPIAGRFTPGTYTNQIQAAFREPRLLVVCDPRIDHQPVTEASYVNIPVIAFANTDSPCKHVDIVIPCNNKGKESLGLVWWLLAREVLRLRGTISRDHPWEIVPDLFFFREPEDVEKEEKEAQERAKEEAAPPPQETWAPDTGLGMQDVGDWAEQVTVGGPPTSAAAFPAPGEDWGAAKNDWATESAPVVAPGAALGGTPAPAAPVNNEWVAPTEDSWA